jgi:hypothetical protein
VSRGRQAGQAQEPGAAIAAGQLLRLALDLQVDALLFSVSADATSGSSGVESVAGQDPDQPPWERWLAGDLEAVLRLAESVVEEHLPLPSVLSGAHHRETRVLDDLRARYTTILALLSEAAAELTPLGTAAPTVRNLLRHYEERLQELGREAEGPVAADPSAATSALVSGAASPAR